MLLVSWWCGVEEAPRRKDFEQVASEAHPFEVAQEGSDRTLFKSKLQNEFAACIETALPSSFFLPPPPPLLRFFGKELNIAQRSCFSVRRVRFIRNRSRRAYTYIHTHRQTRFLSRAQLIFFYLSPGFLLFFSYVPLSLPNALLSLYDLDQIAADP